MAATVTRWLRAPAGARLCAVAVTIEAVRLGQRARRRPTWRRSTRIHNEVWDEWVPGERPVSEAAYVDIDRFTAHPEQMVRRLARDDARRRRRPRPRATGARSRAACTVRVFVDPLGAGEGRRAAPSGGRWSTRPEPRAHRRHRRGGRRQCAEEAVAEAPGSGPDLVVELNRTDPRMIPDALLEAVGGGRRGGRRLLARRLRRAVPVRRAGARLHPRPPRHERRARATRARPRPPTRSRSSSPSRRPASPPTRMVERRRPPRRHRRAGRHQRDVPPHRAAVDRVPGRHRRATRPTEATAWAPG